RREVPDVHLELDGKVDRALGDEHVLPEIADAARRPRALGEVDELLALAEVEEVARTRVADDGVLDAVDRRYADLLAVQERAVAARRPPATVQRGRRHDADLDPAVPLERDQRREHGDAADEVLGAVDRVEDPTDGAGALLAALLAEHGL